MSCFNFAVFWTSKVNPYMYESKILFLMYLFYFPASSIVLIYVPDRELLTGRLRLKIRAVQIKPVQHVCTHHTVKHYF